MSRLSGLLLQLLPLLSLVIMAESELEPPNHIHIRNYNGSLVALWSWDDDEAVNSTAFYNKSGTPPIPIPGCIHIAQLMCHIPSQILDVSERYTLQVRRDLAEEDSPYLSIDFIPNRTEPVPPPRADVLYDDGIVIVKISTLHQDSSFSPSYGILIQSNDSIVEKISSTPQYWLPKTSPGVSYCISVKLVDLVYGLSTSFGPANCFITPPEGSPKNLRMEAIGPKYLLKWDWDYEENPNVTFSVQTRTLPNGWKNVSSCQNITTSECDVSDLQFYSRHVLRTFVHDRRRAGLTYSNVQFSPVEDAVMGPPKIINTTALQNDLYISVGAPDASDLDGVCVDWMYHLEFWEKSTPNQVTHMENKGPHFHQKDLTDSTTYCMRARKRCRDNGDNRTGLYSDIQCVTTNPRSYMTEWITGSIFVGIILISVTVYICLCPLKRYMKHIFFPSSKLPSSIGKDMLYSSQIRVPLSLNKEETFDCCHIIQSIESEIQGQMDKKSQDSGNYSNEDELTGEKTMGT